MAPSWFAACVTTAFLVCLTSGHSQEECYKSLFVSETTLTKLKRSSSGPVHFSQLYKLSSYRREVTYPETCGYEVDHSRGSAYLTQCQTDPNTTTATSTSSSRSSSGQPKKKLARRSSGAYQPCCQTEMSFTVPETVTDVVSGAPYTATHYASSYQLLHTGHCVTEGATCAYQGRCEQATRIEWVLVDVPGGNMFVPTSVPSHCTCIYT